MFDIAVIGAGPAGLAACRAAAGKRVALLDDNPAHGGQIWRGAAELEIPAHVTFFPSARVFDLRAGFRVLTDTCGTVEASRLILCTGARELFLPFPGWTSPGVFGAGGLQAFVKSGLDVRGKRVAVAGSGPLLLAVPSTLRAKGAKPVVIEQAPFGRLWRLLRSYPAKLPQAIRMKTGVPMRTGVWPVRFDGRLHLSDGEALEVDYVACGFGLEPNTEAAQLLGCRLDDGFVAVDSKQQTSVPGIYCAGEPTGIGGLEKALAEGTVAGRAACGLPTKPVDRRFVRDLIETYRLHPDLAALAQPDTPVCRCENVPRAALDPFRSWREAKLQTRCGMGACQGRICGPITRQLYGWTPDGVRPPIVPVAAGLLDQ